MKPLLLCFVLLLCAELCGAQNYACLQQHRERYFINKDGYLRGIRIDSAEVIGADTILYPFKTQRHVWPGTGLDESNGSWMGSKVRKQADGTFTFPTIWMGNVVIRTQAQPGDTWTFYVDGSPRHYEATVTAVDTMTVMGVLDSVKTIRVTSYTGTLVDATDPVNGYELMISKENGFVQAFDLYLFPYRTAAGAITNDFYQDMVGSINKPKMTFVLTEFHVPTVMEVSDFNVGDVFVRRGNTYNAFPELEWLTYDSIVSKTIIDAGHVRYRFFRKNKWSQTYYPWGAPAVTHGHFDTGTYTLDVDTTELFSMPKMPEEMPSFPRVWHYLPNDSSNCVKSAYYKWDDVVTFEGGQNYFSYKTGFGLTSYGTHTPPWPEDIGYHSTEQEALVFSVKNGVPCGMRVEPTVGVSELSRPAVSVSIYPNPVMDILHINTTGRIGDVNIYDMTGRIVYSIGKLTDEAVVDVSKLAPGVYVVRAEGLVVRFVKE